GCEFMRAGGKGGEGVEDLQVDLAGICLSRDGEDLFKAEVAGDFFLQLEGPLRMAVEEVQKRGLRARGPFGAEKRERAAEPFPFERVHKQMLEPKTRPLADGRWLRDLVMGETEARACRVLFCKTGQKPDCHREFLEEKRERLFHLDQVGIV